MPTISRSAGSVSLKSYVWPPRFSGGTMSAESVNTCSTPTPDHAAILFLSRAASTYERCTLNYFRGRRLGIRKSKLIVQRARVFLLRVTAHPKK
jgi:hypothetical protein